MTPKEKAKELLTKMMLQGARQCALIAVDEVLKALPDKTTYEHGKIGYWNEVKEAIKET